MKENLKHLINVRKLFEGRFEEALVLISECEGKNNWKILDGEKRQLCIQYIENCNETVRMMKTYTDEIDTEILRIKKAIRQCKTSDIEKLKMAFEEFILTDTSISLKSIRLALYDYDQFILSMRDFNEMQLNDVL